MFSKMVVAYALIAFAIFVLFVLFGKVFKKVSIGNGVQLGILNSLLLSVAWPITMVASIVGMTYEVIKLWKRL